MIVRLKVYRFIVDVELEVITSFWNYYNRLLPNVY